MEKQPLTPPTWEQIRQARLVYLRHKIETLKKQIQKIEEEIKKLESND